jgi:signal peptidase II
MPASPDTRAARSAQRSQARSRGHYFGGLRSARRAVIFVALFLCTTGFDQASKQWAQTLPAGKRVPVISGVWDWELAQNKGIAFSRFEDVGNAQLWLSLLAAAMLVAVGIWAWRTRPEERLKRVGLALIAGGALGNLIDRVRIGSVTDFIRWRAGSHMGPIFNVADAALLVGVVMLLLQSPRWAIHRDPRPTP